VTATLEKTIIKLYEKKILPVKNM